MAPAEYKTIRQHLGTQAEVARPLTLLDPTPTRPSQGGGFLGAKKPNMSNTTLPPNELKLISIDNLRHAQQVLDQAQDHIANLEGPGYANTYKSIGKMQIKLGQLIDKYTQLAPPTGIHQW